VRAGPDPPAEPRIVGRYAIYEEIASGGMASVHFARLTGPSGFARTVAIKRAHPHLARDPDFALMFLDEARLASRIRHSNVVSTIDVLQTPTELVLVMDYVHGESLWKLVRTAKERGERVPTSIAASIMIDTLHGLHAAHEAKDERGAPLGIVHRDVSPQNILVGVDGITRLVDFGIAKAAGRLHSTRDSSVKGKYAYMAPEQARGEPVSRLTDTYAAAIVFWEILTGERLFVGKNEAETIHKCLVGRVQPPSLFVPGLGPQLDEVLRKALSREPAKRYQTARDMALDIESCVPAIRPSEVGSWVERIAEDTLSARATVLADIERTDAGNPPRTSEKIVAAPATQPVSWEVDGEERTGVAPRGGAELTPQSARTIEPSTETPTPVRSRRTAVLVAVLLAVLGVSGVTALVVGRRAPGPTVTETSTSAATPEPGRAVAAPSASAVAATAAPADIPAPAPGPLPSVEPSSPVAAATDTSAKPGASATRPSSPAPSRGGSRARPKRSACNPPYSIDSEGRQIFKPECM
jgi:serine/threonine protein kinase